MALLEADLVAGRCATSASAPRHSLANRVMSPLNNCPQVTVDDLFEDDEKRASAYVPRSVYAPRPGKKRGSDSKRSSPEDREGGNEKLGGHSSNAAARRRIAVSTFRRDDGSPESVARRKFLGPCREDARDPFLHFLSNKRRMEHLFGRELPHMSPEEPKRRKTAISFKLDPLFVIVESFPELYKWDERPGDA